MSFALVRDMPTILVVDDEPSIRELVRFTLEDERVAIVEASDGVEALEKARAARPELILLDVHMPRLDGIEACRRLRTDATQSGARIVLLTGYFDVDAVPAHVRVIHKPFTQPTLQAAIAAALDDERANAAGDRGGKGLKPSGALP